MELPRLLQERIKPLEATVGGSRQFALLPLQCTEHQNCSIPANTNLFGDPCAGTLKYLEAHYRCIPAATTTTTTRPSPPWLMASQPNVWSTAKLPTLRPPSHPPYNRGSAAPPLSTDRTTATTAAVSKVTVPRELPSTKPPQSIPSVEADVDDVGSAPEVTPTPLEVSSSSSSSASPSSVPSSSWKTTTKMEKGSGPFSDYTEYNPLPTASRAPEGDVAHFCPPVISRNLDWNWTHIGDVNVQPCPGGAVGLARWRCVFPADSNSPKWSGSSPDLSQCRSVWLTSLDSRIEENDSIINVANDMSQVTSSKTLYGGDMMTTTTIVKKLTERISRNIQTFPDSQQREAIVTELLQSVVKTTSNLLDSSQDPSWKDLSHREQMRVATSLLVGLEENAFLLADTVIREKTVVQSVKNICEYQSPKPHESKAGKSKTKKILACYFPVSVLSVRVMDVVNVQETERFPGVRALEQRPNYTDWLEVPRAAMLDNSEGGFVRLIFVAFERLDDLLQPSEWSAGEESGDMAVETRKNTTRIVNSKVISASLGKGRHIQFNDFVRLGMKHLRTENVSNPSCVFWDYTTSAWSEEGCEIELTNKTHTICRCNHLTNFAVLMDAEGGLTPPVHQMTLQIITYIGCVVSIICLLLAVITFHLFRSLRSDRTTIHKNLGMCLLLAEVLFLLGISQTDKPILCGVVAGLLHFVFLCAFAWMFLEGFHLYIMLIEVFEVEKSRIRWYYMFAYGAPLIIVCISCVVDPLSYGNERYCWLRADNFFIFSFVGPVIAVILANLVFLSMAIYMMCRHSSASVSLKSKEHSRLASARTWLRGAIVLVFLLGLTWTFGLLYLSEESVVMAYVFTVLNSLQGLFIFLFHCLHNEKVRKEYKKWNSWLPKCVKCKKYQSSNGTISKERRSSVYGTSHGPRAVTSSHTHSSTMGDAMMSLPNGNSSVGTEILGASHRYHHPHNSSTRHQGIHLTFLLSSPDWSVSTACTKEYPFYHS
ncbi:hypothetical protein RUM44_006240 [Polyplax serrata]|uniref:Latrophilin Cirl n=1 Tax=Polyplax serrata TaxID=468196 RepID=A0ABR1AHK2_POLSC